MALLRCSDLTVFQKAHALVLVIYKLCAGFPGLERYALADQMRRAAVSIPANIAEGYSRHGVRDQAHYYEIAKGSAEN